MAKAIAWRLHGLAFAVPGVKAGPGNRPTYVRPENCYAQCSEQCLSKRGSRKNCGSGGRYVVADCGRRPARDGINKSRSETQNAHRPFNGTTK